jgi:tetratricopeptide (TPR) repeat protein
MKGADPAYPGARPFTRDERARFFGRTAEAALLADEWRRNNLTFLVGPAGIGKTSLLTAGVLPLVDSKKVRLLPVGGLRAGPNCPVAALREHNPYTLALLRSWSGGNAIHLAGRTVDDFIRQYAQQRDPDVPILAAIDQADDLFAGPRARQLRRRQFLRELTTAVQEQPALHLLISVRSDTLQQITDVLGSGVQFQLDPLKIEKACEAVAGPGFFAAEAADLLVGSVRTSRIVTAAGMERIVIAEQVEPALLQVACARLWESLREQATPLTLHDLERHGTAAVDDALAGYCSATIAAVAAVHDVPVEWLRSWLIDTFITEVGELDVSAADLPGTAETPPAPARVAAARALEDCYLIRAGAGQSASSRLYRLISERLIEPLQHSTLESPPAGDPDEYLRAAERARITGESDLAIRLAERVLLIAPDTNLRVHAEAHSLLGDLAYEHGQLDQAEYRYTEAAKLFVANSNGAAVSRLYAAIAKTYSGRNKLEKALENLAVAVRHAHETTVQVELQLLLEEVVQQAAQASRFRKSTA